MHAVGLDEGFPEVSTMQVEEVCGRWIRWNWGQLGQ